jgi:hypothetical protein
LLIKLQANHKLITHTEVNESPMSAKKRFYTLLKMMSKQMQDMARGTCLCFVALLVPAASLLV